MPDRATTPLLRHRQSGQVDAIDWDHALQIFTLRFKALLDQHGPESVAWIGTGQITTEEQRSAVQSYVTEVSKKSDLERTELAKDKTGVFTGAFAINPVNRQKIPIWIADYVLASYGTGAIMAVPGHDTRDFEFATKFNLPIVQVVPHRLEEGGRQFLPRSAARVRLASPPAGNG